MFHVICEHNTSPIYLLVLKHPHIVIIRMSLIFRKPVSLSLVGYTATVAKYVQSVFEVHKFTTSTKISASALPYNHLENGYSENTFTSDELYLHFFQMHMKIPIVLRVTVNMMMIGIMNFAVPFCSSIMDGSGGHVKICCSSVMCHNIRLDLLFSYLLLRSFPSILI